jgi:protease PrsW
MPHVIYSIVIAFLGGFIPVLVWLWFFEHEDKNPEPLKLTLLAFIGGMLSVVVVLPFENIAHIQLKHAAPPLMYGTDVNVITIIAWAAIEEIVKYTMAYFLVLRRIDNDEPIDSLMYMIVIALGFAALENVLYVFRPLYAGQTAQALVTGNFRFMGATLLHVVSSSIIGIALAFSYYEHESTKRVYAFLAIIGSILLHTFFNLSIIISDGSKTMISFYTVWIALIVLLLMFEKIKNIKKPT